MKMFFGQHVEDVFGNFPGARSAAFWGMLVSPSRRDELQAAAFIAAACAWGKWFAPPAPRLKTIAERRLYGALIRAESFVAGVDPAAVR